MYDIITFGSAAQDIIVKSDSFKILNNLPEEGEDKGFSSGQGICLPFGSKIDVKDIVFSSGGGGTNTAATFSKQGFKVAFCGAIGADIAGLEIIRELRRLRVDTRFLVKKKDRKTNSSIVISGGGGDRTIMVYRGASDILTKNDIPWRKIKKTKWFYLAPFAGLLCDMFGDLVSFAKETNIKVAVNPSKQQLLSQDNQFKDALAKTDILFLNQEEASIFTGVCLKSENEKEILQKINGMCHGIVVVTKAEKGVVVFDGSNIYSGLPDPERKVIDATGAGDSFASGFLSDFIRQNGDIEKSIQLGLANSAANLSEPGAKTGILDKNSEFKRVEVKKT